MKLLYVLLLMPIILLAGCTSKEVMKMKLESPDLGEFVPARFTCDGEDINPELRWSEVPEGTKSFALMVWDPDAPMGTFIHWMVYNIPADKREIKQGEIPGKQVINDFGKENYGGPCPPSGTHRYFFTLYALDVEDLGDIKDKHEFMSKVEEHTIAKAEIMSKYSRP